MEGDLNLKLGLGLPGREESEQQSSSCLINNNNNNNKNKRSSSNMDDRSSCLLGHDKQEEPAAPPPKAQVVGWPPVRSYRRNVVKAAAEEMFVKVSMDGAPYLRKIDLKLYNTYFDLLKGLEEMFKWYNGSEHAPTYEDKDGDWMLLGDVPWDMFITSCKRLRIIKASDAKGLGACS